MYADFRRFRLGAIALILSPIVVAGVLIYVLSSPSSSPPPTTLPGTVTTLPGATTTLGHLTTIPSTISPSHLNLAGRKASVLAGEARSSVSGASQFDARFLLLANHGPAPHYRILTALGGYAKYPQVVRIGVVGSSQVICVSLANETAPQGIPAPVVACP